jgi:hypothetical protein
MSVCIAGSERIEIRLSRAVPVENGVRAGDRCERCECELKIGLRYPGWTWRFAHFPAARNAFIEAISPLNSRRCCRPSLIPRPGWCRRIDIR